MSGKRYQLPRRHVTKKDHRPCVETNDLPDVKPLESMYECVSWQTLISLLWCIFTYAYYYNFTQFAKLA